MLVVTQEDKVVFNMNELTDIEASGCVLLITMEKRTIIGGFFTQSKTREVLRNLVDAYEHDKKVFRIPKSDFKNVDIEELDDGE